MTTQAPEVPARTQESQAKTQEPQARTQEPQARTQEPQARTQEPQVARGLQMHPVQSSNIVAVGYSPGPEGKPGNLSIDFRSGVRYVYEGVPAEEFEGLLKAESPGRYHAGRIKGVYGFHKAERSL